MNTDLLPSLVEVRRRGEFDEQLAHDVLVEQLKEFTEPVESHSVWWNSDAWVDADLWDDEARRRIRNLACRLDDRTRDDGWRKISRSEVFDRADNALDLYLTAMAFGFGDRGYGWYRTAVALKHAGHSGIERAVEGLREASAGGDFAQTWRAWSRGGPAKIEGIDTAFASKLAYFACFDRTSARGPLVADANTAWALWALEGTWDSRTSGDRYRRYVEWAEEVAERLGCRPDDIERALFVLGTETRHIWRR